MSATPPSTCEGSKLGCAVENVGQTINDVGESIGGAVSFFQDPWGNMFATLQDSAVSIISDGLSSVSHLALPDLSSEWFLRTYAVSFALALLAAVVVLMFQFVKVAKGSIAGSDVLDTLALYWPAFLVGSMFGPAFGTLLIQATRRLGDDLISWGVQGSMTNVIEKLSTAVEETDALAVTGGVVVGCLVMLGLVAATLFTLFVLLLQLVALYFSGVVLPLGLLWITDPGRRVFGWQVVSLWLGILLSHPLLLLLLGAAFAFTTSNMDFLGNGASWGKLAELLASMTALFVAAFSPFILLKLAPVIPAAIAGGSAGAGAQAASWGAQSMNDWFQRRRDNDDSSSNSSSPSTEQPGQANTSPGQNSSPQSTSQVGTEETFSQRDVASAGRHAAPPAPAAPGPGVASEVGAGAPGEAGAAGEAGSMGAAGGGSGAGSAAAAAGGASEAATAAEAATVAGAAESSTGIGAIVGVPTAIAGVAVAGTAKVAEITEQAEQQAESVGNQIADTAGEGQRS